MHHVSLPFFSSFGPQIAVTTKNSTNCEIDKKSFKGYRKKTALIARWMQHVEDRPEVYQPFTQLGSEADQRVHNGISSCTQGMNLKLTPEMVLDKRC